MDVLRNLCWRKLPLRLRNVRNAYAREHPLFIFKGILKFACSRNDPPLTCDYLFHPVGQAWPKRIGKGQIYDLEIVFPSADEDTVHRFMAGLESQLAKQPRNFAIESLGPVEVRNLAALESEAISKLDVTADEVCLDFVTPFSFNATDALRPWLLDAQQFVELCTVHLARLFPLLPWPLEIDATGVYTLPYFWEPADTIWHRAKSQPGRQPLSGLLGPLYLRGEWQKLLPSLLLCAELHTGYGKGDEHGLLAQRHVHHPLSNPLGAYCLRTKRDYFDRLLKDPGRFIAAAHCLAEDSDTAEDLARDLGGAEACARATAEAICDQSYQPKLARLFAIEKKTEDTRTIALLGGTDAITHRTLHDLLGPVFNRMFEHASIGYRPGLSIEAARTRMNTAIRTGASYAVRADVESFFDTMDWDILGQALRRALPEADTLTLAAVEQCVRMPAELHGVPVERTRGVLQGSALSPLLANLYLDTFDEAMAANGHTMMRYGDDFLIFTSSRDEAERALADANVLLAPMRLSLNPEKTAVTPLDLGFTFLGMRIPSALEEETVGRSVLRKSLFIKETYAFTGIDGDSIVVRKNDALLARLPLHRVAEIVFLGNGAVSTRLLQKCATLRIPVSFCSAAGWYSSTLKPDSKSWFALLPAHVQRHEALGEAGRLDVARRVVEAKLRNYCTWLRSLAGATAKQAARTLEEICEALDDATSVEALRGYEGSGARLTFHFVNRMAQGVAFVSGKRVPREKPDRFNALLDLLYSLLFTRLNVLLRSAGLNPYLGFLHSPLDYYESLVCDLQEPFRCRMDRLALKLLNRKEITAEGFEQKDNGAWRLTGAALGNVIEAFAREEQVRLAGEPSTLGQLLAAQVLAMGEWVAQKSERPAFFLADAFAGKAPQKSKPPTTP